MLDNLIENGQFSGYVQFILNREAEERNNQMLWEYYLHKIFDKSFSEFKKEMLSQSEEDSKKNDATDEAKRNEIIKKSNAILDGFIPRQ